MTKILLIEDDLRLAELTREYLTKHGFTVVIETHGNRALAAFEEFRPDLLLLDLNLPGKDGVSLCREIRELFLGPIIMMTARDTSLDQVIGLESGADDYITKPVDPMVLLARIRANMRSRSSASADDHQIKASATAAEGGAEVNVGELTIKLGSREVRLNNEEIFLTNLEFEILRCLATKAGQIVDRDQLHEEARGFEYDGLSRVIDTRISALRKKLDDDQEHPRRIKTVWGKGYLLSLDGWS